MSPRQQWRRCCRDVVMADRVAEHLRRRLGSAGALPMMRARGVRGRKDRHRPGSVACALRLHGACCFVGAQCRGVFGRHGLLGARKRSAGPRDVLVAMRLPRLLRLERMLATVLRHLGPERLPDPCPVLDRDGWRWRHLRD